MLKLFSFEMVSLVVGTVAPCPRQGFFANSLLKYNLFQPRILSLKALNF